MDNAPPAQTLQAALACIPGASGFKPEVALVLGSGLGSFADTLTDKRSIPYTQLPGMPRSAVAGHAGNLVLGRCGTRRVVAMQGRVHLYEGHTPAEVVFGARLMLLLGARTLIATNAAGGIGTSLRAGDLMLIEDHLNLTGHNCLCGPNDETLGPRFPDMSEVYDRGLIALAGRAAQGLGFSCPSGVYAGMLGPSYETPAEIRMLRTLGADAVGMSTVLETIAARHMGARCLGVSCITNLAAGLCRTALSHTEVQETARASEARFKALLRAVIEELPA